MSALDVFSQHVPTRLDASARLGLKCYGLAPGRFKSLDEREEYLRQGFERLAPAIPKVRGEAAAHPRVMSYGAWNPLVMFVGLTPGTQPLPIAREYEHVIGAPDIFARWPGAKGNPWFPAEISDLTKLALEEFAKKDAAVREFAKVWPAEFDRGARSACLMLNLREVPKASGGAAPMELSEGVESLRRHISAFRPNVLVAVSPKVSGTLARMFDIDIPQPLAGEPTTYAGDMIREPLVTMPLHPNAKGTGFARYQSSKPSVARAIADALER